VDLALLEPFGLPPAPCELSFVGKADIQTAILVAHRHYRSVVDPGEEVGQCLELTLAQLVERVGSRSSPLRLHRVTGYGSRSFAARD
jgi:hypothetical protein